MTDRDWEKERKDRIVKVRGCEPIAQTYAEIRAGKQTTVSAKKPRQPTHIDGIPNPENSTVRKRILRDIEAAFRSGLQPIIYPEIMKALATEIRAIRSNPDVQRAYHAAVGKNIRPTTLIR
jgi:hypothetical protein